ncbi:hypothetical protein D3C81_1165870 [compost metagenome]
MAAALADRQAGKLTDRREVIGLDKTHRQQLRVERAVLLAHGQVAFGKVQVAHLAGTTRCGAEADAAGIGEQVQHAFAGTVLLDPATGVAQVEEQQRVLPGMAATHPVVQTPFVTDMIGQRGFAGLIHRIAAVDAAVALGAVVVDQQQFLAQVRLHCRVQLQQGAGLEGLVETLHQQLRAVAVDGQAAGALLAAMEQAIAVGALGMQFGEKALAGVEGGAQRLIQEGHARGLGLRTCSLSVQARGGAVAAPPAVISVRSPGPRPDRRRCTG